MRLTSANIRPTLRGASIFSIFAVLGIAVAALAQEQVARTAADAKPLKVNAVAPDSTLRALDGKEVKLRSILSKKPTVLIFYRGGWCPFCNAHLSELAKIEGDVRAKGYQIVAVSPDTPEELSKTVEKDHLTYKLFSDSNAEAMKKFGVAFRVDDETFTMYRDRFKIDLERSSGQKHHILPVPSVFVIDRQGKILFAYSNPDYKVRLKSSDLLAAIDGK